MDFEVGTVVYAKLRGYPWWPARIEKEESLPKEVHSKKPKGQVTSVKFFGTKDYGWVNKDDLKPFVQNEAEDSLEKMKNSKRANKLLEKSIRDAFNPSSLDEDNSSSMDTDDFNNDNRSSPNNENDEGNNNKSSSIIPKPTATVKSKAQGKGRKITKISSTTSSATTTTTNGRKRKGRQPSETSNDLNNGGKSSKKRKANNSRATDQNNNGNPVKAENSTTTATNVQEINDASENQADLFAHDHSSPTENQESSTPTAAAARSNKTSEHEKLEKKLLRLRRRLQRLVLKDGGIEPQDVEKVNEIFEEIEKFPVSVLMLRVTKVGKLMREISRKKFDYDPRNIVGRSTDLISRWQTLLEDNNFTIQIDNAPSPKDEASANAHINHGDQSTTKLSKDTNNITTTTTDTIDDDDVAKSDDLDVKNDVKDTTDFKEEKLTFSTNDSANDSDIKNNDMSQKDVKVEENLINDKPEECERSVHVAQIDVIDEISL